MNYSNIYQTLVSYRKSTFPLGYTEKHHIIPRCLGGTDEPDNMVVLTAREHFIVHQLLVKMYPKNGKLIYAVRMMSNMNRYGSKKYSWIREMFSEKTKGKIFSETHKKKLSESAKKPEKIAISKQNLKLCNEVPRSKALVEKCALGHVGLKHTDKTKAKQSESTKGKIKTKDHRENISKS
jgi:hypothetical protein